MNAPGNLAQGVSRQPEVLRRHVHLRRLLQKSLNSLVRSPQQATMPLARQRRRPTLALALADTAKNDPRRECLSDTCPARLRRQPIDGTQRKHG